MIPWGWCGVGSTGDHGLNTGTYCTGFVPPHTTYCNRMVDVASFYNIHSFLAQDSVSEALMPCASMPTRLVFATFLPLCKTQS